MGSPLITSPLITSPQMNRRIMSPQESSKQLSPKNGSPQMMSPQLMSSAQNLNPEMTNSQMMSPLVQTDSLFNIDYNQYDFSCFGANENLAGINLDSFTALPLSRHGSTDQSSTSFNSSTQY